MTQAQITGAQAALFRALEAGAILEWKDGTGRPTLHSAHMGRWLEGDSPRGIINVSVLDGLLEERRETGRYTYHVTEAGRAMLSVLGEEA